MWERLQERGVNATALYSELTCRGGCRVRAIDKLPKWSVCFDLVGSRQNGKLKNTHTIIGGYVGRVESVKLFLL